ncbi:nuclear transport factor 2 family protein [Microbacterium sp. No. 7]|uniref:nuclear transport factor 2 family protein n=1 Tax=Microbacterium sp. No. 7 TaxID=1714373 RepID=UPI0009E7D2FF|nr:nuclear transport factor 2 family protein [Microbacterium sp. No. 7]
MTASRVPDEAYIEKLRVLDVLHLYCRGVDRCHVELIRACYHPDSFDDHGYWKGNGQDFAAFIAERLRRENAATSHRLSNTLIEIDGDRATAESYVQATLVRPDRRIVDVVGARYLDVLVRGGEHGWLIMRRVVALDWRYQVEAGDAGDAVDFSEFALGARFPLDPIHAGVWGADDAVCG